MVAYNSLAPGWNALRRRALKAFERDDQPCCRCGGAIDYSLSGLNAFGPTVDHLDPLALGGAVLPDMDRLAPAHHKCNARHGGRLGVERKRDHRSKTKGKSSSSSSSNGENVVVSIEESDDHVFSDAPSATPDPSLHPPQACACRGAHAAECPMAATGFREARENVVGTLSFEAEPIPDVERWEGVDWLEDLLHPDGSFTWPRLMTDVHPNAIGSYGDDVIRVIEERREADIGIPTKAKRLRPWQRLVVQRAYEHDKDGELVWKQVLVTTSRQVGKSTVMREIAMERITCADQYGEEQLVLQVAKDMSISNEIQRPLRQYARRVGAPWMPVDSNGAWAVHYGEMGRWLVRSMMGVYGYSASLAICDEVWDIDGDVISEGIEPTQIEREQAQLHMYSTAHSKAKPLFPERRRKAIAQLRNPGDVLLMEWSAPPNAIVEDVQAHRLASPHWDERRARFIADKVQGEGFREQWLNIWPSVIGDRTWVTEDQWTACYDESATVATGSRDNRAAALWANADQDEFHLVIASRTDDDAVIVTPIGVFGSLRTALDAVKQQAAVAPLTLLAPRVLRGRWNRVTGVRESISIGESDLAAATTTTRSLVASGELVHGFDKVVSSPVVKAIAAPFGDTHKLSSSLSPNDISAAKAIVCAVWWSSREEGRKAVVA